MYRGQDNYGANITLMRKAKKKTSGDILDPITGKPLNIGYYNRVYEAAKADANGAYVRPAPAAHRDRPPLITRKRGESVFQTLELAS